MQIIETYPCCNKGPNNVEKQGIILSVQNLSTKLLVQGKTAKVVDNISFDLHSGKTLALVGESGCGKSMTALSIMRILPEPPALYPEGKIWFKGQDLLSLPEKIMRSIRGDRIAMIFQDPMSALNPVYTVGNQLLEVVELHLNIFGEEAQLSILKALDDVGISDPKRVVDEYPHKLSGGMKQRVMIAMALLCEPDVLIADEPTTALDVTIQKQVLDLIKNLQAERGMALLLITHDMGVVAEMADDVVVMYSSRSVEQGNVYEIFDNMSHPYTQGLFLSRPHLNTQKGKLHTIPGNVPPITNRPQGCHFTPRCPYAMPSCQKGDVPKQQRTSANHTTFCWLYHESVQSGLKWD
ncbi:MAG: peptide/nickel transport system ATP-binding protein [Chlamydiales bacterium]|jgi:peptide/nickel transport system ATP-binding protein